MHSRLSEHDAANISNNSRKDHWTPDVSENLKDKPSYGRQISSAWPLQESHKTDGLPTISSSHSESYSATIGGLPTGSSSSLARIGMQQQMGSSHLRASDFGILANVASGSMSTLGQQHFLWA
ncbi:hypothetical protein REPUB_Repub02eG0227700 [Reevesia pubescens]